MRVVIAGGHGQIAMRLGKLLTDTGHHATGLIRNPDHAPDLTAIGVTPATCDLETADTAAVAQHLAGADAAIFAAGAGPGSGAARKDTVDRAASELLAEACQHAGVRRLIQVSSIRADDPPPDAGEIFTAYLRAKATADERLRARDLDWTILRPGSLTNQPGTGHVTLAPPSLPLDQISRDDVAAVLAELLANPTTAGHTLDLTGGDTPIRQAVAAIAS